MAIKIYQETLKEIYMCGNIKKYKVVWIKEIYIHFGRH